MDCESTTVRIGAGGRNDIEPRKKAVEELVVT